MERVQKKQINKNKYWAFSKIVHCICIILHICLVIYLVFGYSNSFTLDNLLKFIYSFFIINSFLFVSLICTIVSFKKKIFSNILMSSLCIIYILTMLHEFYYYTGYKNLSSTAILELVWIWMMGGVLFISSLLVYYLGAILVKSIRKYTSKEEINKAN